MNISKLAKENPKLKKAWDDYGHVIAWDNLFDAKIRNDGCYVVLAWKEDDDMINMADLACSKSEYYADGGDWEMQNDSFISISPEDWKKLHIVPECDWFVIPGNSNYRGL